ncbi:Phosphatidylinositol-4-phosphate 5-kinase, core [Sesbania bispinosa]|nr:Phosphatidylinositol-4-phosphate 5-kinase, core [Sesbania bispinosa]
MPFYWKGSSKHLKGGKESRMDVLVMENLLFRRNVTRLYDLKGSSRSRYNADSTGKNKVLLDQNLIEAMPTSPIFVGNKAKRLLERGVWNDTGFLASVDVMDYLYLLGWMKRSMNWHPWRTKEHISNSYITKANKKRFRKAMTTYFLMLPDQWSPPSIIPSHSQSDLGEDNSQSRTPAE